MLRRMTTRRRRERGLAKAQTASPLRSKAGARHGCLLPRGRPPPVAEAFTPQTTLRAPGAAAAAEQLQGSCTLRGSALATVPEGVQLLPAASDLNPALNPSRDAFESWAADAAADLGQPPFERLDFDLSEFELEGEEAVARRTRAHVSLADVDLDELEALLVGGDEDRAAEEDAQYQSFLEVQAPHRMLLPGHRLLVQL